MKIVNPNRFLVRVGDMLEYNQKAIDYINVFKKKLGHKIMPSAPELNKQNPTVKKYEKGVASNGEKFIELWVEHNDKYTGFSGVVWGPKTDVWCLDLDGSINGCPDPLFKRKIVN